MMPSPPCEKVLTTRAKIPARVLIVDDEPLVRWSLSSGLRSAGFDAVTASSGAEALTLARQPRRPDVVLLDLQLYDADPRALIEEMRLMAPRCRFILLTTAGQEMPVPGRQNVVIVEKPFDLADVVRLVGITVS